MKMILEERLLCGVSGRLVQQEHELQEGDRGSGEETKRKKMKARVQETLKKCTTQAAYK